MERIRGLVSAAYAGPEQPITVITMGSSCALQSSRGRLALFNLKKSDLELGDDDLTAQVLTPAMKDLTAIIAKANA